MRMEYLRYLLEISRHRSISTAAQALYLSQTSLSTTVRRIEDELGFHIFSRTHSGVEITAEGEEALALITEILTRFDKIQRLGKLGSATTPAVLLLSPTISDALSIPLSQMFLERLPEGNLEFHIASGDEIGSQIINSKSNNGVTYYSADHLSEYCSIASKYLVEVSVLCRDQLYLLVWNSHPLAGRAQVSIGELNHLNFAILPPLQRSGGFHRLCQIPRHRKPLHHLFLRGTAQAGGAAKRHGLPSVRLRHPPWLRRVPRPAQGHSPGRDKEQK